MSKHAVPGQVENIRPPIVVVSDKAYEVIKQIIVSGVVTKAVLEAV